MKILYIITKSNWGGAQRHVYDLATAVKSKGHTPIVALGGDGVLMKRLEDAGVKTHTISQLGKNISLDKDAASFKDIFRIIKREKPDILHLHSPKAAGLGALAGRTSGVKKILVTVHGFSFNEDRPTAQKLLITFFSWLTMLLAHKTVLLSEKEYSQALRFPGVKNKLSLIPLGIKQPVFISIDGAKREISRLICMDPNEFSKRILIGTLAELHPNKGLPYLVNALEQTVKSHPNVACVIVGDGQDAAALHLMVKDKKLENNVFLTGYLENASEYLKAFNIFVLPSIKEGLPYAILEAAYASLPVVATTVGGIPEIVEDMKSGVLVQPKNSKELAHALSFMIEHPHMRREYGAALRESVAQKFSLEKMIDAISALYNQTRWNLVNDVPH
ncbi:glycosyltransferase family 4 protein [Patescibacteria group bacterium]|nr:glycosyltransferase family 4 protein [Patescibacteria group bacterium]MDE1946390.1 glycosyltransferase family 4 protein [Patescibacteria group bacterium]MDE2011270.1 glycosyltransferase family 4 protein [Patescibacteria group bacterium]MDE2233022.1 glycosyltransferase family 4 protein [Patescibacteria group bacterium]